MSNKRNNYIPDLSLTLNDLQTEQDYLLSKIENATDLLSESGVANSSTLEISPDCIVFESVNSNLVLIPIEAPLDPTLTNSQNYSIFPLVNTTSTQIYTIFKTITKNIQRIDLRLTLAQDLNTENLDFIFSIKRIVDPLNPMSSIANLPAVAQIQLKQEDIPSLNSDTPLTLDFSNENSGQGISVLQNSYYALVIEFRRAINSSSRFCLFHNPLDQSSTYDKKLFSWVLENQEFKQGYRDTFGAFQQFILYSKVYTSAIKISAGEAIINGKQVEVLEDQFRFLEIPDRRNSDIDGNIVYNYIVLEYAETYSNPEMIVGTQNKVYKRIVDSSSIQILTQGQWDNYKVNNNSYLLLATVVDSNVVSIFNKQHFEKLSTFTKLMFHDWLNPLNTTPNSEALALQRARDSDFIFYVCNIPAEIPQTDSNGTILREKQTTYDSNGNIVRRVGDPILENISKVLVDIKLSDGKRIKTFELSQVSEVGSSRQFKNYALTISSIFDNPFDNVFTLNYNIDEILPNVIYNFVAYTQNGKPVFIQDYNKVLKYYNDRDKINSIRNQEYTTFLQKNQLSLTIDQDLQLGSFNPQSDQSQPGVVQYVPTLIQSEIPTPLDPTIVETISENFTQTLLLEDSFIFQGPLCKNDLVTKIRSLNQSVKEAYDEGSIQISVDLQNGKGPIDIINSGDAPDSDKGGNGSVFTLVGNIKNTLRLDLEQSWEVKVRSTLTRRDNTNYSYNYTPTGPVLVGGASETRTFRVLIRGKGSGSNAGFEELEQGFVYINDRKALDSNYNPIIFTFSNSTSNIIDVGEVSYLGDPEYLREKKIYSTEISTLASPGNVLINTGTDRNGNSVSDSQVIFNLQEIPFNYTPNAIISIRFNKVNIEKNSASKYKLKYSTLGSRDGILIENTNNSLSTGNLSVPEAIALVSDINQQTVDPSNFQTIAIFCDGINITSNSSPIGKKVIVANDGIPLNSGEVSLNPQTGEITFYKNNLQQTESPEDYTRITVSYFKLDTRFIFHGVNTNYNPLYDLNGDGRIDDIDLALLEKSLFSRRGDYNYSILADFNNDGIIDLQDFNNFISCFGSTASGERDYQDATSARMSSLLLTKKIDFSKKVNIIKAVSRAADTNFPNGRTILFLDSQTPINESAFYNLNFGFSTRASLGFSQIEVETILPLSGIFNYKNIKLFNINNLIEYDIVDILPSITSTNGNYKNLFTINPPIYDTSDIIIKSIWNPNGIISFNRKQLLSTKKVENLFRKVYGPFALEFNERDFDRYGSFVRFKINKEDSDDNNALLNNIPINKLPFTAHLTVTNDLGVDEIWTWHNIEPTEDSYIFLDFNEKLFLDHRNQGRNSTEVLTPFGMGSNQVRLKPEYLGGHLKNDLSNISLLRSDIQSKYVKEHSHQNVREGGVLNSDVIQFNDELSRLNTGDLNQTIYKLLDLIQEQSKQIQLLKSSQGNVWDSDQEDMMWDGEIYWD